MKRRRMRMRQVVVVEDQLDIVSSDSSATNSKSRSMVNLAKWMNKTKISQNKKINMKLKKNKILLPPKSTEMVVFIKHK
jgi:hypothetical protein